jgi:hypothetical protein
VFDDKRSFASLSMCASPKHRRFNILPYQIITLSQINASNCQGNQIAKEIKLAYELLLATNGVTHDWY